MIKGITHVAITVRDMSLSLQFYMQALGFKKAFEIANPDNGTPWIVYLIACKGQFVELFYDGSVENPWRSELMGFNHLCFEVGDIHKSVEQIKEAGFAIDKEPKVGCDYNWQAWVTDPNGIRIELMQMDPRSPHAKYM